MVATAFIDFRKAFDWVSQRTLLHKLKTKFGIEGSLLSWLTDYLHHQTQVTVVNNSTQSEGLNLTSGIPQGTVQGPCLFSLYTNDITEAVTSGNLYPYADDTTAHCIGFTVDGACNLLHNALNELNKWCITNSLTLHSSKCEVMLFHRGSFTGPLPAIIIEMSTSLTWANHLKHLRNNFVKKLNLLKKCSLLKRKSLLDLYFKVILPSVTYGIAV